MTQWTKFALAAAAGGVAAIFAATPAYAAGDDGMVKSLCKVEISADEVATPSRRPETVGFIKRVDGQVAVLRPTRDGVDELKGEVGMDLHAYDAEVRQSQARRWVVYEALRNGAYFPWDFQPLQKASERYMRNHMDLNEVDGGRRFPRGE